MVNIHLRQLEWVFFLKIKSYFNHRANGNHDLFQEGENPRKLMIGFALT